MEGIKVYDEKLILTCIWKTEIFSNGVKENKHTNEMHIERQR